MVNYAFLGCMFANQGFEFCGIDQTGFGKSEGTRGQLIENEVVNQSAAITNYVNSHNDPLPVFILGHSFGATIASMMAKHKFSIKGVCLVNPYF